MDRFSGWLDRLSGAFHNSALMRSGYMTMLVVAGVLASAGGLWYEHIQGNFHKVRVIPAIVEKPTGAQPGGMSLVRLTRTAMISPNGPEFVSAVLAPGLGMEILQATISVPSVGEVPLLASTGDDAKGDPTDETEGSPIVVKVAAGSGRQWADAVDLLGHRRQPDRVSSNDMPDGMGSEAFFSSAAAATGATDRGSDSGIETTLSTTLGGRSMDIIVSAKNVSRQERTVVLSWEPRFSLRNGGMALVPPHSEHSGAGATPPAIALGAHPMAMVYPNLKRSYLMNGTEAQLRNDRDGYILHMVAISPTVRSLRVDAPKGGQAVVLAFSTSTGEAGDNAQTMLKPGESLQMQVRLQVTQLPAHSR